MKVLVYSAKSFEIPYLNQFNNGAHQLSFVTQFLSIETTALASGYDAVSIFSADRANADILKMLHRTGVRYIALRSTGFDNVNIKAAVKYGIKVAHVPGYSPHAVAEHAIGLMLSSIRRIPLANQQLNVFNFSLDRLIGFDLFDKNTGVIGTGRIGKVIVSILHGMGCRLFGNDVEEDSDFAEKFKMQYLPLDELLSKCDVVFLALPLNPATKKLIGAPQLRTMKNDAYLINIARGGVVDTLDVLEALDNEQLGFYATDVYEKERGVFFYDHSKEGIRDPLLMDLLNHPKVLLTPHQAFATKEAIARIAETTVYNLNCWAKGEPSQYELT